MRTQYEDQFCLSCLREVEHIKFTYLDQVCYTCTFCQESTLVKEDEEVAMKKTYTIIAIDEKDRNSGRRRMVVTEIECKSEPDSFSDGEATTETFKVQHPAYGNEHYTSSVARYPSGATLGHLEAKAISEEIKKFVGG